jgi:NAD(P)-dependent dehydrogenase (short-subunit alcohol dehydrogenase family)
MDLGLAGKTVMITGAARGIGRRTAERFASEGARVVACDVAPLAPQLEEALATRGGFGLRLDVTSEADWATSMDAVRRHCGALHVLVNNAGVVRMHDLESLSLEDWRADNAVNVDGVFLGTRAAIIAMRETGGAIVNVASVAAMVGIHTAAGYCAGKGAVRAFTKAAALHCVHRGYPIRVNSVHPGYIETPMVEGLLVGANDPARARRALESQQALGRLGSPDDVAAGIVYLAGDSGCFVTGAELVIDGGYLAR